MGWSTTPSGTESRIVSCYCDHRRDRQFLVNRRMNKSRQMRWSRRGADLLLQLCCALDNGTFDSGFGQRFHPANDIHPQAAIAA
jgi:hypothetical protein